MKTKVTLAVLSPISRESEVGGSSVELPRQANVDSVQQHVQQQGRTTAGAHDREQHW